MPNFNYRKLLGVYRAGVGDRFSDVNKIDNMFIELSRDVIGFNNRITALEAVPASMVTSADFVNNTITGLIILENTLPGSKITDQSITGAKIVINSANGITDANVAPAAAIQLSKLDLSTLSHSDLLNIGTLSHPALESGIASLTADMTAAEADIDNAETAISNLQTRVGTTTLNTVAQTVTAAINELQSEISGYPPLPSGDVTITGTQTQYHIITATGVNDTLGVTTGLKALAGTGQNSIQSLSSVAVLSDQASATVDGSGNAILSAGSAVNLVSTNNHAVIAAEEAIVALISGTEIVHADESGVTISLPINMDLNKITNLAAGVDDNDAVTMAQLNPYMVTPTFVYQEGAISSGINLYAEMTDNSVTLPSGTWDLQGEIEFFPVPGSGQPGFRTTGYLWALANGDNTPSIPTLVSGLVYGQAKPGNNFTLHNLDPTGAGTIQSDYLTTGICTVQFYTNTEVFLVPYCQMDDDSVTGGRTLIRARRLL